MIKRLFDIVCSLLGIFVLLPLFALLAILIKLESKGPVFFRQIRVGKSNRDFVLYKFRSMYVDAEKRGQLTIGMRDPRITRIGFFLRRYKLDELPQLFNVLSGTMSFVGPRPEVRRYVELYSPEQMQVLQVQPGITDYASLKYFKENEILGQSDDPEHDYVNTIMPEKLAINISYIKQRSTFKDITLIIQTIVRLFVHH
jgi:lipopolysaccharide/colanic/teichoic acid biosynthesis glycosyltransferase